MDAPALREQIDREIDDYRRRLAAAPQERILLDDFGIGDKIPHVPLADGLPTPITSLDTGSGELWVKRDDLTSSLYGGNKVRKLEFVLADVARRGRVPIIVGATASHQVLASVLFGRLMGIECEVVVFPQPPTPEEAVLTAVLDALDVSVHRASTPYRSPQAVARTLAAWRTDNRVRLVYPGSSSAAGALGYVNCGLEIAHAVNAGACPEPDVLYTAFGTGGTTVGLALGLELGGLASRVCAVRVGEPIVSNMVHLRVMEWRTRRLLGSLGVKTASAVDRISLETSYLGSGYGHPIPEAQQAVDLARGAGLPIDQTYTAKALAAALDHQRRLPAASVMFVETLAGQTLVTDLGVPG